MTLLPLLSDLLLLLATIGLALFCWAQARRAARQAPPPETASPDPDLAVRLMALEARLAALPEAAALTDGGAADRLSAIVAEADDRIGRLELLLVGLGDMDDEGEHDPPMPPPEAVMPSFRASRAGAERGMMR
jgi:hypothetical protein